MPSLYLLDTNAYYLFFQHTPSQAYNNLVRSLTENGIISFYISEITSLEIHSVIGKYRRGISPQQQKCCRKISKDGVHTTCSNTWLMERKKRLKTKVFRDLQKMILDIENQSGIIQATILPLDSNSFDKARSFLVNYSDRFKFGSHDALIAGTALAQKDNNGLELITVTSDRGFKVALSCAGISYIDPNDYFY